MGESVRSFFHLYDIFRTSESSATVVRSNFLEYVYCYSCLSFLWLDRTASHIRIIIRRSAMFGMRKFVQRLKNFQFYFQYPAKPCSASEGSIRITIVAARARK